MGYRYTATCKAVATLAVAGSLKTVLSVKVANTAGLRGRVTKIVVVPAEEAPQDVNLTVELNKSNNTTDGGTSATAVTPKPVDKNSAASALTARKDLQNGGAADEPTTMDTEPFTRGGCNGRGGYMETWPSGMGPLFGHNEAMNLRVAPGAAVAVKVNATIEWEEA